MASYKKDSVVLTRWPFINAYRDLCKTSSFSWPLERRFADAAAAYVRLKFKSSKY